MEPGELWHWGRSAEELAALAGVHLTTARRWKAGARPKAWLLKLLAIALEGELGEISRAWRGWRIHRGELVSPEGWRFTPGNVRSIPFLEMRIASLEADRRFPRQADWIEGRFDVPRDRRDRRDRCARDHGDHLGDRRLEPG